MNRQVGVGMAHSTSLGLITIMLDSSQTNHSVPHLGSRARRRLRPDKIKAAYKAADNPNNKRAQYLLSELYWRQIYHLSCSHPHFVVDLWKEVLETQGSDIARKLIDDILVWHDDLWCRDKTAAILAHLDRGEMDAAVAIVRKHNGDFDGMIACNGILRPRGSLYFRWRRARAEIRAEVARLRAELKAKYGSSAQSDRNQIPPDQQGVKGEF